LSEIPRGRLWGRRKALTDLFGEADPYPMALTPEGPQPARWPDGRRIYLRSELPTVSTTCPTCGQAAELEPECTTTLPDGTVLHTRPVRCKHCRPGRKFRPWSKERT